ASACVHFLVQCHDRKRRTVCLRDWNIGSLPWNGTSFRGSEEACVHWRGPAEPSDLGGSRRFWGTLRAGLDGYRNGNRVQLRLLIDNHDKRDVRPDQVLVGLFPRTSTSIVETCN